VILRVTAEATLLPRLRAYLKSRLPEGGPKPVDRRAHEVLDNAFLVSVIAPLSAAGWWVLMRCNGPCTPFDAEGCLVGWPDHPVDDRWRWWWLSVGGLYCGEMIGTALGGVGFKLPLEMVVHHVVTMALMVGLGVGWGVGGAGGRCVLYCVH